MIISKSDSSKQDRFRTPKVTNVHRVAVDFPYIWIYYEGKLEERAFPDWML